MANRVASCESLGHVYPTNLLVFNNLVTDWTLDSQYKTDEPVRPLAQNSGDANDDDAQFVLEVAVS